MSYKQVLFDLKDKERVSYKGTANEIRETLREVLDYLAPDKEVKKEFPLEKEQDKPTQKQKVSFILKKRNRSKAHIHVPLKSSEIIETSKGGLVRAVYNRSSMSVHKSSAKAEIIQLKKYLDSVLSELLELYNLS